MIETVFNVVLADPLKYLTMAVIMVSALIVFLGLIKPYVFDKIPNKYARKTALGFASIGLSFACVAICFAIEEYDFAYYLLASGVFSFFTIIVYWFYEFTNLRTLIHWVGSFVLQKFTGLQVNNFKELKQVLIKVKPELEKEVQEALEAEAKSALKKVDTELEKL